MDMRTFGWGLWTIVMAPTALASSVLSYDPGKVQTFVQTSAAVPVAASEFSFYSRMYIDPAPSQMPTASVTNPDGITTHSLAQSSFDPHEFFFQQDFASLTALDTAYPLGTYSFAIVGADFTPASQTGTSALTAAYYPQSIPYFTNYTSFSSIDASQDFTFQWSPAAANPDTLFTVGFLRIFDTASDTKIYESVIQLPGVTTGTIPAGTMTPGQEYRVSITYSGHKDGGPGGFGGASTFPAYDYATEAVFAAVVPEPGVSLLGGIGGAAILLRRRGGAMLKSLFG